MREWLLGPIVLLIAACGVAPSPEGGFGVLETPDPVNVDGLCLTEGLHRCLGDAYEVCRDGAWVVDETCTTPRPLCVPDQGCVPCNPDRAYCVGEDVHRCSADGFELDFESSCEAPDQCLAGQCPNACDLAEAQRSYLGCDFLAVATSNITESVFDDDFAVVIGNPHPTESAVVEVSRDGRVLDTATVAPESSEAVRLAVVPELKAYESSVVARGGAFEVSSTMPVAAYQFNPLNFRLPTENGPQASFSNDASLLLPTHVLTSTYRANTHPSFGVSQAGEPWQWLPGFVAVAATEDETVVTFTSKAETLGGEIEALAIGEQRQVTLQRGDVAQFHSRTHSGSIDPDLCAALGGRSGEAKGDLSCFDTQGGDLTGSVVTSTAPVAVFAGHTCSFIPVDAYACDHLEEMMFPRETLGTLLVMTAPKHPSRSGQAAAVYRILSAVDDNFITVSPAVVRDARLDAGEFLEFDTDRDFAIISEGPVHVTQSMVGQRALNSTAGDPAMGSGVPLNQWRSEYDFFAPETYVANHVTVTAAEGTVVYLDGLLVEGWEDVDGTNYDVARVSVGGGPHHIESLEDAPFGLTSYGYGDFTSYLTPGGMNFVR